MVSFSGITPVPDWFFWTLVIGTVFGVIMTFLFLITVLWTPAMAFLKAKLKNLPIFLMSGRDGLGGFYVPEFAENQYAHFKKAGTYGISRDSHIWDRKSKQPIYIADKDIGASIKRDWPEIVDQMKQHFRDLKNGKDYKRIISEALQNEADLKKNPELLIKGATIKVSDLAKYFPMNIKPTYIDEYAMIAVRRDRRKQNSMQWWVLASVLIICVGIAGYLLIGKANEKNQQCSCSCDYGSVIEQVCGVAKVNTPYGSVQKVNGTMSIIPEVEANNAARPGATLS